MRILLCALGAIIASLLTACGSGNNTQLPANIRIVNALFDSTSPSVTFSVNGAYALTQGNNSSSGLGQIRTRSEKGLTVTSAEMTSAFSTVE